MIGQGLGDGERSQQWVMGGFLQCLTLQLAMAKYAENLISLQNSRISSFAHVFHD